jgi:2-C-methyl-D-erythritol 4-phosphate cytidylyltransferase
MRAAYVVLAGGRGTRLGADRNKVYLPLAGRPVIAWSFLWAAQVPEVDVFLLVTHPDDREHARSVLGAELPGIDIEVVDGGATRHRSEQAALSHLEPLVRAGRLDVVAIHDGARPLARTGLIRQVLAEAAATGGAIPAVPATNLWPPPGERVVGVQTPQAFRAGALLDAYAAAAAAGFEGTDTCATIERFTGLPIRAVDSDETNLKITYPGDVARAEALLSEVTVPGT